MTNPSSPLIRAEALIHRGAAREELRGVSVAIEARQFTLLSGPRGSGAALLLRILGLLERPEAGEVWFESRDTGALDDAIRLDLRNHAFGYIFAEPFLLDSFSVAENVAMPLFKISKLDIDEARMRTAQVLDFAGLAGLSDFPVSELSVLDQHKLSVARAIATAPQVVIAEEAGAELTPRDRQEYLELLRAAPRFAGAAVIATSPAGAKDCPLAPDREIRLEEGLIAADSHPVQEASANE